MRHRNMSYTYNIIISKTYKIKAKMSIWKSLEKWIYIETKYRNKTYQ